MMGNLGRRRAVLLLGCLMLVLTPRTGSAAATLGDTAYFVGGNKGCGGGDVTDELLSLRLR